MKASKDAKAEELEIKRQQKELEKKDREERKRRLEEERREKKEKFEREREAKRIKLEEERQAKNEQKMREQKEKEEQRLKKEEEKRKRDEEKRKRDEEKRKKDEERQKKEEEKQKKLDEKRLIEEQKIKKELEEKEKKEKLQNKFRSFFKQEKSASNGTDEVNNSFSDDNLYFKPFQLQPHQSLAQLVPEFVKNNFSSSKMDAVIERQNISKNELFLCQLKNGYRYYKHKVDRLKGDVIVDDDASKQKAKLLKFHDNNRPPYFGTWRKKSFKISARNPFAKDEIFNYDVDSDDEWEEEEKGESLKDSDSDASEEEGDGYELDEMFVSHGYLSDDEQNDEGTENTEVERHGILTKEEVLLDEKRKPVKKLTPIVVGCVWRDTTSDEKSLKILEQYRATYLTV